MRRPASVPTVAATLVVLGVALSACFTTAADFRKDAETYIVESKALRGAVFPDASTEFTAATCAEPKNQDVGTTFACNATDTNGDTRDFQVEITGSAAYEVTLVP